jgi:hypothetical protein
MSASDRRASKSSPGDMMLHPVAIGAVVLLIANDHVLRGRWPDALTGKLSDVAGLVFFPLLLQALVEVGRAIVGREHRPSQRVLVISIVMTGLVFAAGEFSSGVDYGMEVVAGWLHRPFGGAGRPGVLTQDAADLIALPSLLLAWFVGHRRGEPTQAGVGAIVVSAREELG